jgi:hypothetical protein
MDRVGDADKPGLLVLACRLAQQGLGLGPPRLLPHPGLEQPVERERRFPRRAVVEPLVDHVQVGVRQAAAMLDP